MKTKSDLIMENIAVLDTLARAGFSEILVDRVEHAINSHVDNKRCPECENPNQFGELCDNCYGQEQQAVCDAEGGY